MGLKPTFADNEISATSDNSTCPLSGTPWAIQALRLISLYPLFVIELERIQMAHKRDIEHRKSSRQCLKTIMTFRQRFSRARCSEMDKFV